MTDYLENEYKLEDPDVVSVIDEIPLWSAPFGLKLLEVVELKRGINALDVGCGLGFPMLELAMRLGPSCRIYGIDPWEEAVRRIERKIRVYKLDHAVIKCGVGEHLPFDDGYFDLLVSNNGINNVGDMRLTLEECARVARAGAQMVMTMNLEATMREFYTVFEEVLIEAGLAEEISRLQAHIHAKRPPLEYVRQAMEAAGFSIRGIEKDEFELRFLDGSAMFRHFMIRLAFLPSWMEIVSPGSRRDIFARCEELLNTLAKYRGELRLSVPYVVIDARRRPPA